jgi:hypothetical protein
MLDIEKWTPLATFCAAYVCAVVGAVGQMIKIAGDGGRPVTPMRVFEAFVYWGPLAVAFPMLAWETLIIQEKPVLAIAVAWLFALGVIKVADVARTVRGYLKLESPPDEPRNQPPHPGES